jgi:hypothetical protein
MAAMKCPDCGARRFYVKDPQDQYTLCEFSLENGIVEYLKDEAEEGHIEIFDDTETYCDRCAWHDKFKTLK